MPHTQHFTVAKWSGTGAEAAKVTFSAPPPFPINIPLSSRKPWQSCFALGVDDATAAAVTKLTAQKDHAEDLLGEALRSS